MIIFLVTSLILAFAITPFFRQLAFSIGLIAVPKDNRFHKKTTPLLGGVVIVIATISAWLVADIIMGNNWLFLSVEGSFHLWSTDGFLFIGTILWLMLVGVYDDRSDLAPLLKLVLQSIPIALLILFSDIHTQLYHNSMNFFDFLISYCWFMFILNAFNYIDNMDGISGTVAIISSFSFIAIAMVNGQTELAIFASVLVGSTTSFLYFNLFNKSQTIFMGDGGTLPIGFMLAAFGLLLRFEANSPFVTWPVPILVLSVLIFDTSLVFISRIRRKRSFLDGGTDHFAHRLLKMSGNQYVPILTFALIQSMSSILAIIVMHSTLYDSIFLQIFIGIVFLYLLYIVEVRLNDFEQAT